MSEDAVEISMGVDEMLSENPVSYPTDRELVGIERVEELFELLNSKRGEYAAHLKSTLLPVDDPNYSEKERFIELASDVRYGIFGLEKDEFQRNLEGDRLTESEKLMHATIAQALVHELYKAGLPGANQEFVAQVYDTANFFQTLSRMKIGHRSGVRSFWKGVVSELAVVKLLKSRGFDVYLPDYTQDPWDVPDAKNQVLQWDVRNGVDLIAYHEGRIYLIDSKGRARYAGGENRAAKVEPGRIFFSNVNPKRSDNRGLLPASIRDFIHSEIPNKHYTSIEHKTVTIPSSEKFVTPLAPSNQLGNRGQTEMSGFAVVNKRIAEDLIRKIK